MTQLSGTTDIVQLPVDGTGKKTGAKLMTLGGQSVYVSASVQTDSSGNIFDKVPVTLAASDVTGNLPVSVSGTATVSNTVGYTIKRVISAASTNGQNVKASAGTLYGWYLFNANTSTRYLKLYNLAGSPTVGTSTIAMTIPIPGGAAANVEFARGIAFTTGIAMSLTTGVADNDTGVVAASDLVVNLFYS